MSVELNFPARVQPPLSDSVTTSGQPSSESSVVSDRSSMSSQQPSGEHAARLRSQGPLTTTRADSGLASASTTQQVNNQQATASVGRVEASGVASAAAVANLNVTPTVMTSLHAASTNLFPRKNGVPDNASRQQQVNSRPSSDDQHKKQNDKEQTGETEVERLEQKTNARGTNHSVESRVEPDLSNQQDVLFVKILNALVRGGQSDMLRQLQGTRRIVAVFTIDRRCEQTCEAQAVMLWRDAEGGGRLVSFPAQLDWTARARSERWIRLRGHKDRAANPRWHLRVQPLTPTRSSVSFQIGAAARLPGVWKDVNVTIPDAPRFWSTLAPQFSVQIVISAALLPG